VGLGYFEEVRLGFLLVGHTHSDIDQRFSCISHVLKGDDISSVSELLGLIQNHIPGHADEPIRYAWLMENIWDWKDFITPHLHLSGGTEFVGLSEPHHFRFFQRNGKPHVQHKIYANDAWGPTDGHLFLASVPNVRSKPGFAEVFEHNHEEVAALHSFVNLKERQLDRHIKLHASQGQLQAYQFVIVETKEFIEYLQSFPDTDKTSVHTSTQFWWSIPQRTKENERGAQVQVNEDEMNNIVSLFPTVECRGYFGPQREAPRKKEPLKMAMKRKRDVPSIGTSSAS
jgi:hypothetical protein